MVETERTRATNSPAQDESTPLVEAGQSPWWKGQAQQQLESYGNAGSRSLLCEPGAQRVLSEALGRPGTEARVRGRPLAQWGQVLQLGGCPRLGPAAQDPHAKLPTGRGQDGLRAWP